MDRTTLRDALCPECPIRNVLARLGDKWSLLVIYTLDRSPSMRFGELLRALPDISQKMLTVTLRMLEEDGLVTRSVYPEIPPRVEYALTERARSLLPHVNALIGWAAENMEAILADRQRVRSENR
ncbi:helix-turn-helix domain-containing protein [uncultured Alistipes sp.]|jgi:DNA-binding HxlR family transcriptional regulator|uniref:winged helix-turn-helix transcriptional regulator n=1 Tax=uncultured Alistipes sp. TaxID=538949 RepID=UPI00272DA514|nr:helix-turn-helix domain-containing protein [uncultured Alistipes sp.]